MGKKSKEPVITITRFTEVGAFTLPSFVHVGHRHLEKQCPDILPRQKVFNVPVDVFRVTEPQHLTENIESVEFHYKERN